MTTSRRAKRPSGVSYRRSSIPPANVSSAPAAIRRARVASASETTALSSTSSTIQDRRYHGVRVGEVFEYGGRSAGAQLLDRVASRRHRDGAALLSDATRDIGRRVPDDHEF